jgi:hypothetical protein
MDSEPKNLFSWRVDFTHFLDLYARERIKWVRIRLTSTGSIFTFEQKIFTVDRLWAKWGFELPHKKGLCTHARGRGVCKTY